MSIDDVYTYVQSNLLEAETDYVTENKSGDTCAYDQTKGAVKVLNRLFPTAANNVEALIERILEGPVLVEISADVEFVFYQSGIIDSDNCSANIIHPVLIVGFGV